MTLAGTDTLAGSVIALDSAVRNVVAAGLPLPDAVAAASANPLALLGVGDRGRIAVGQRADLVELDDGLRVCRVMRAGAWIEGVAAAIRRPAVLGRSRRSRGRVQLGDEIDAGRRRSVGIVARRRSAGSPLIAPPGDEAP